MSVLAAAADTTTQLGTGEAVVFWILGPVALAGALGMALSLCFRCSSSSTSSSSFIYLLFSPLFFLLH